LKINPYVPDASIFNKLNTKDNKTKDSSGDFLSALKSNLDQINSQQLQADTNTQNFIAGKNGTDINDVMISTEEAKMSLELAVQIRNKLVDAYQEINRTQV